MKMTYACFIQRREMTTDTCSFCMFPGRYMVDGQILDAVEWGARREDAIPLGFLEAKGVIAIETKDDWVMEEAPRFHYTIHPCKNWKDIFAPKLEELQAAA